MVVEVDLISIFLGNLIECYLKSNLKRCLLISAVDEDDTANDDATTNNDDESSSSSSSTSSLPVNEPRKSQSASETPVITTIIRVFCFSIFERFHHDHHRIRQRQTYHLHESTAATATLVREKKKNNDYR